MRPVASFISRRKSIPTGAIRRGDCWRLDMQSRLQSFIEAWANTLIGYFVNLAVQLLVYPLYGATFTFSQNIQIGLIFMMVSIVRSYMLRRGFNWLHGRRAAR